jgi:hypothetical protein
MRCGKGGDVGLVLAQDLTIESDFGQFYLFDDGAEFHDGSSGPDDSPELQSLGDAVESGRFVGRSGASYLNVLTPGQWNFELPLRVEVHDAEPRADLADWQHVVDVDLDLPTGRVVLAASGGGARHVTTLPAGAYRARVAGRGFTELGAAGADGDDVWRLQLWPRAAATEPHVRRRWAGWDDYR